jgi:hypothetical protein
MPSRESLDAALKRAASRYRELESRIEETVARWEISTDSRHSFEPFYFERHRCGAGKVLARAPESRKDYVESGFDAEGRLIVERSYTSLAGRCYETFYEYLDGCVDKYHFGHDPKKPLIHVARHHFDGERLRELEHVYRQGGRRHEVFEWEGDRLVRVIVDHAEASHVDELSYDDAGRLLRIEWVYPNGSRAETYGRVAPSLPALLRELEERTLAAVPQVLERFRAEEPAYAVALCLDMEGYEHVLPPSLAVALQSEREAFSKRHGPARARDYLWSPTEWRLHDVDELEYREPALLALASDANQLIWQKEQFARARKHVDTIAKRLNQLDWSAVLPVTDDFVVFSVDVASGDGIEGVRRAVPAKKRALLRERELI